MQQTPLLTTPINMPNLFSNNPSNKNSKSSSSLSYHQQQLQMIDKGTKEWMASTNKSNKSNDNNNNHKPRSKSFKETEYNNNSDCNYKNNNYNNGYNKNNDEEEDDDEGGFRNCGANTTERVPVASSEHVAEIVGRQGSKIKALRAKTNTYIKTPVRGEDPIFVVTGRPDDVTAARLEILSVAEHFDQVVALNKARPLPFPDSENDPEAANHVTVKVRVPYRVVGLLVGPKGATIKRIQLDTQTYIVTPSRDKEPVFEITGTPENVSKAKTEIEGYIALRTGLADLSPQQQQLHFQLQQQLQMQLQQQLLLSSSPQSWRNGFNPLFCMDLLSLSNNHQCLKNSEKASLLQYLQALLANNSDKKDEIDWSALLYDTSTKNNNNNNFNTLNNDIDVSLLISNMQTALNNINNNNIPTNNNNNGNMINNKNNVQNNKNVYYWVDPTTNTTTTTPRFDNIYNANKLSNLACDTPPKRVQEVGLRKWDLGSYCQTPVAFLNEDMLSINNNNINNNLNNNFQNKNNLMNNNIQTGNVSTFQNNLSNYYKGNNALSNSDNYNNNIDNENITQNYNSLYTNFGVDATNNILDNKSNHILSLKNDLNKLSVEAIKDKNNNSLLIHDPDLSNNYDLLLQQNLLNLALQNNTLNMNQTFSVVAPLNNNTSIKNNTEHALSSINNDSFASLSSNGYNNNNNCNNYSNNISNYNNFMNSNNLYNNISTNQSYQSISEHNSPSNSELNLIQNVATSTTNASFTSDSKTNSVLNTSSNHQPVYGYEVPIASRFERLNATHTTEALPNCPDYKSNGSTNTNNNINIKIIDKDNFNNTANTNRTVSQKSNGNNVVASNMSNKGGGSSSNIESHEFKSLNGSSTHKKCSAFNKSNGMHKQSHKSTVNMSSNDTDTNDSFDASKQQRINDKNKVHKTTNGSIKNNTNNNKNNSHFASSDNKGRFKGKQSEVNADVTIPFSDSSSNSLTSSSSSPLAM